MHPHLTHQLATERQRDLLAQAVRARPAAPRSRRGRRVRVALLCSAVLLTLAVLALPAQADAAFGGVSPGSNGLPTLFIQDGSGGQNNRIVLSQLPDGRLQLFDTGLAQTPGSDCVRGPSDSLICTGARQVNLDLAGGDDTLATTTSLPTSYSGGFGADVLFAGNGPSTSQVGFSGGPGRDRIQYAGADRGVSITKDRRDNDGRIGVDRDNIGPDVEELMGSQFGDSLNGSAGNFNEQFFGLGGDDVMTGGPGLDVFTMEAQADGADRVFGGDDFDSVEYDNRTRTVTVNLSDGGADDGEAGEGDELRQIEDARTGSGNDTLKVNPASTTGVSFQAGLGTDTITGTDAADSISAFGGGRDTIDARGGDDRLGTRDSEADSLACGQGTDTVSSDSPSLDLQTGCERQTNVGVLALAPKVLAAKAGGVARLRVSWRHPRAWRQVGQVTVHVRDGDRRVGEIAISPRAGRTTARGAVELVRHTSRVRRADKTIRAQLGVRLDPSLAGRRLVLDVEAADVRGRRQLERGAGVIRVGE